MTFSSSSSRRAQSVLYAVLLMPLLLLIFALAIDIGMLQLDDLQLHYALDISTVTAATKVDQAAYDLTGRLHLDSSSAIPTARQALLENLLALPNVTNPEAIAANAEIAVVNQIPGRDPFNGAALDRPAVCARLRVPHRFSLLGWIGLHEVEMTVTAEAEIRT